MHLLLDHFSVFCLILLFFFILPMLWDTCLIDILCSSHRLVRAGCTISLFPGVGNSLIALKIPSFPDLVRSYVSWSPLILCKKKKIIGPFWYFPQTMQYIYPSFSVCKKTFYCWWPNHPPLHCHYGNWGLLLKYLCKTSLKTEDKRKKISPWILGSFLRNSRGATGDLRHIWTADSVKHRKTWACF